MAQYEFIAYSEVLKGQVKGLNQRQRFGEVLKLLKGEDPKLPETIWIRQQQATSTYKDQSLLPYHRFDLAPEVLEELAPLSGTSKRVMR